MRHTDITLQNSESESFKPSPTELKLDSKTLLEFRNQAILSNLMNVSILTNRLLHNGPWKSHKELTKSLNQHTLKPKMTPSYRPPFLDEDNEYEVLRRKKQLYRMLVNHLRHLHKLLNAPLDFYNPRMNNQNYNSTLTQSRPMPSSAFYRSLIYQHEREEVLAAADAALLSSVLDNSDPQNQAVHQNNVVLAPALPGFDDANHAPNVAVPSPSANQAKLDEVDYKGDIPDKYICPLSGAIMTTPVVNAEKGLPTVEKSWIEAEINRTGKNPYNYQPLSHDDLQVNNPLAREISDFVDQIVPEEIDNTDNFEVNNGSSFTL